MPDTDGAADAWLELNRRYGGEWPNITKKKEPPADADNFKGVEEKFKKFFSAEPGS